METFSLADVQKHKLGKKEKDTSFSFVALERLYNVCSKYGLHFPSSVEDMKVDPTKVVTVYKFLIKQLGGDESNLELIIKYYLPISRLVKYFIPETNPIIFNIFLLREHFDFYAKAATIMSQSNYVMDWLTLKRKMEEQGEDYASFKRFNNNAQRSSKKART